MSKIDNHSLGRNLSRGLLLLLAVAPMPARAIELSAKVQAFTSEGVTCRRLSFTDDKRTIFYQPPPGWDCALVDKLLRLTPKNAPFAEAQIEAVSLNKPVALNETTRATLAQQVMASLPPMSQQAAIVKQEQNALLLNSNPTYEVLVTYKTLGDTFERTVFVVCTPNNKITFKFSARKSDFDALYRAFRASIATWEWQPAPDGHAS